MWIRLVIALLVVINILLPNVANACSCAFERSAWDAREHSDAVFLGEVKPVWALSWFLDFLGIEHDTTVEVTKSWKGVNVGDRVLVRTSPGSGCGLSLNRAETWLMYLDGSPFELNACSRSMPEHYRLDDIKALEPPAMESIKKFVPK